MDQPQPASRQRRKQKQQQQQQEHTPGATGTYLFLLVFGLAFIFFLQSGAENGLAPCAFTSIQETFGNASNVAIATAQRMSEVSKLTSTLAIGHLGVHHKPFWVSCGAIVWGIGMMIVALSEHVVVLGIGHFVYGGGYAATIVLMPPILDESVKKVGFHNAEQEEQADEAEKTKTETEAKTRSDSYAAEEGEARSRATVGETGGDASQQPNESAQERPEQLAQTSEGENDSFDDDPPFSPAATEETSSRDPHRASFFVGVVLALSVCGVIASFLICAFTSGHWQKQYLVTGIAGVIPAVLLFLVGLKMYASLSSMEGLKKAVTDTHRPPFIQTMLLIGFKNRIILLVTLNQLFALFFIAAATSFLPKFIEEELGQSKKGAALVMAATIPAIVSSIFVGGLVTRLAKFELNGCLTAVLVCEVVLVPFLLITFGVEMPIGLFILMEVTAMMVAFFPSSIILSSLAHAVHHSKTHESYANGFFNFVPRIVGTVAGPITAGAMMDSGMGIRTVFVVLGTISLVCSIITQSIAVWYNKKYGIPPLSDYTISAFAHQTEEESRGARQQSEEEERPEEHNGRCEGANEGEELHAIAATSPKEAKEEGEEGGANQGQVIEDDEVVDGSKEKST